MAFVPKKILGTGFAGFIGANLCEALLQKFPQVEIVVYDLMTSGSNMRNLDESFKSNRVKLVKGDIRNMAMLLQVYRTEGFDSIIHCAAETNVDRCFVDGTRFISTNIMGTFCVLQAANLYNEECHKSGVPGIKRICCFSTDEVFGDSYSRHTEESIMKPTTFYSCSKSTTPLFMHTFHHSYGMHVTTVYLSNCFGPYQVEKLVPKFCHLLMKGRKLCIHGSGENLRSWLYVKDACDGVISVIQYGKSGEGYMVGSDEEFSVLGMSRCIMKEFGIHDDDMQNHLEFHRDRIMNDSAYKICSAKILEHCGWGKDLTPFNEALRQTMKWYKEHCDFWGSDEEQLKPHPSQTTCVIPESVEYLR